jgi:hypothetical protein
VAFEGENRTQAFTGKPQKRRTDLFWDYGRDATYLRPGLTQDASPNLAMRSGDWKLLMNADGSSVELYSLGKSPKEDHNVSSEQPEVTKTLTARLLAWRKSLP